MHRDQQRKKIRSFIGIARFYRNFVPTFVSISAPLTDSDASDHELSADFAIKKKKTIERKIERNIERNKTMIGK